MALLSIASSPLPPSPDQIATTRRAIRPRPTPTTPLAAGGHGVQRPRHHLRGLREGERVRLCPQGPRPPPSLPLLPLSLLPPRSRCSIPRDLWWARAVGCSGRVRRAMSARIELNCRQIWFTCEVSFGIWVVLTVTLVDLSGPTGSVKVALGSSPHWWGV